MDLDEPGISEHREAVMSKQINVKIDEIVGTILDDYNDERVINQMEVFDQPETDVVKDIVEKLLKVIYPGFFRDKSYRFYNIKSHLTVVLEDILYNLNKQVYVALKHNPDSCQYSEEELHDKAEETVVAFFERIPVIREFVETDVHAAFNGDPAAYNMNEIILSYPGLKAITIYRIAHELHLLNVPLIPRMMTEYAHGITGIDIHPGATIGKNFFMDHGTGIVIGSSTIIGNNVRVYQGVTLGALSTRAGQKLRGTKRHPTIEDDVIIYSGASILGGETIIGKGSVIGSNAFITSSIEPGSKVSIKNQELVIKNGEKHTVVNDNSNQEDSFYVL